MSQPWVAAVEEEEITLNIRGAVWSHPSTPDLYVSLRIGGGYETTMHEAMARELRDWLVANVPE